jgi:hypothetical protein
MLFNNKQSNNTILNNTILNNTILNFTLLFILAYLIYNQYTQTAKINQSSQNKKSIEPFDFFTCTMNLQNIDPKFVDEYKQFDGRHVACGPCQDSTLRLNITTCPTNANGSASPECYQNASIKSSLGKPITYTKNVTPQNIKDFFCFE